MRRLSAALLVAICALGCSGEIGTLPDRLNGGGRGGDKPTGVTPVDVTPGQSRGETTAGGVPFAPKGIADLFAFRLGATLELSAAAALAKFKAYSVHATTALSDTGAEGDWSFRAVDWNEDGEVDILGIRKAGGASGKTEVHILNGATGYKDYLLHAATPLEEAGRGGVWAFELGDYNNDGTLDLYAIKKVTTTKTEVHILDGANAFGRFLLEVPTALGAVPATDAWSFAIGDYNGDSRPDVIAAYRLSTKTEIHVLNGATLYQDFLMERASALGSIGEGPDWTIRAGDYNGDGRVDLYAIRQEGTVGGKAELHILDGSAEYQRFLLESATILPAATEGGRRLFDVRATRGWLRAGPPDTREWKDIPHPMVFVGHGDDWGALSREPNRWPWVRDNVDGVYVNFIITDLQLQSTANILQAMNAMAAVVKQKNLFYEADEMTGTKDNDIRNLETFKAAGFRTTHTSYNYTIQLGWKEDHAAVLRTAGLQPGQPPRPALVLVGPWELDGNVNFNTAHNNEVRRQVLNLADGFATDGPMGFYYANQGGFREAVDSLMAFGRGNNRQQALMLSSYPAGIAGYSSANNFLPTSIEHVLQVESRGGSPGAWTIWPYADTLPALPEAKPDGTPAATTAGMAYWLIHHLQGQGIGLKVLGTAGAPDSYRVNLELFNSSYWLLNSPLLQADVVDPDKRWSVRFTLDGADITGAILAKSPGQYFAGGDSLAPGARRGVTVEATCAGCNGQVRRPRIKVTAFGHLDVRKVAQQWIIMPDVN